MRDLRDPQTLGTALLHWKEERRDKKLSETYDGMRNFYGAIKNYPADESLATVTAREYRQELRERAANGDQYAVTLLLEKGWREH